MVAGKCSLSPRSFSKPSYYNIVSKNWGFVANISELLRAKRELAWRFGKIMSYYALALRLRAKTRVAIRGQRVFIREVRPTVHYPHTGLPYSYLSLTKEDFSQTKLAIIFR